MSNLKRKREEGEESGLDDTTSPVKSPTNASTHGADEPSPSKAPIGATNGTYKAETSPAGDSAETGDSLTILICGEEVVLKGTGGRKKRKCSRDTLILTAYKGRLARMCRADNMSSALEIYKEMQAKGIKQDLEVGHGIAQHLVSCHQPKQEHCETVESFSIKLFVFPVAIAHVWV